MIDTALLLFVVFLILSVLLPYFMGLAERRKEKRKKKFNPLIPINLMGLDPERVKSILLRAVSFLSSQEEGHEEGFCITLRRMADKKYISSYEESCVMDTLCQEKRYFMNCSEGDLFLLFNKIHSEQSAYWWKPSDVISRICFLCLVIRRIEDYQESIAENS